MNTSTSKSATSKSATSKSATSKSDRMSAADFEKLIQVIRDNNMLAENSIQSAFVASWRDIAYSHSCERLNQLWNVLDETKSPFKAQVSLAMRALAGMASPVKNGQKWHRTGRQPLTYMLDCWTLYLEDIDKRVLEERATWNVHFRAIKIKPAKSAFTWQEAALFVKRIGTAAKQGRIPEKDRKKFQELLGEIERISAR